MWQTLLGPIAAIGKTWVEGKVARSKAKAEAEPVAEESRETEGENAADDISFDDL